MRREKKSQVQTYMIAIIIAFLSFFIYFNFMADIKDDLSTASDDLVCKSAISVKSNEVFKAGDEISMALGQGRLFEELNNKCKVDNIEISSTQKEEVFKTIGDRMVSCYNRYGSGEKDFLSNYQTTGNWCFLCSVVEFDDSSSGVEDYKYEDLVEWSKINYYKDTEEEKVSYADAVNLRYVEVDNAEIRELKTEISDILSEKDTNLADMTNLLLSKYTAFEDLRLKEIDTTKKNYIVFRYNRYDKSIDKVEEDIMDGTINGVLTSVGIGMGVEALISGVSWGVRGAVVSGGACAVSGVGTLISPICGFFGGIIGGISGVATSVVTFVPKATNSFLRVLKINKGIRKLATFTKSTKPVKYIADLTPIRYTINGVDKIIHIPSKLRKFDVKVSELKKLRDAYAKDGNYAEVNKLTTTIDFMENELKVGSLKDIERLEINTKADIDNLFNKFSTSGIIKTTDDGFAEFASENAELSRKLGDLKLLKEDLLNHLSTTTDPSKIDRTKVKDYVTFAAITASGVTGGYLGNEFSSNYDQYVDVLTQEQYYRLCGTERYEN